MELYTPLVNFVGFSYLSHNVCVQEQRERMLLEQRERVVLEQRERTERERVIQVSMIRVLPDIRLAGLFSYPVSGRISGFI